MADRRYGVDLAEAYRAGEAIKGARTQNKLSALNLSEQERIAAERPERERVAKERQNMLTGLRTKAAGGDTSAERQLLAMDPEGAPKFIEAISGMDERQRQEAKRNIDEVGKLSHYVLQGKTPEEQAKRYETMKRNINPEAAARLPEQYSPQFMSLSLSKAVAMDKMLEAPTVRTQGAEDVTYRGGLEVDRASNPTQASKAAGRGGSGGLKTAGESLMYKQSVSLLGGILDQDGNPTQLEPEARNKVHAIAAEATNIYVNNNGKITHTEAVKQAAKKFGFNIYDAPGENPQDPNNIRNYLLK